jgi:hypothetical protein
VLVLKRRHNAVECTVFNRNFDVFPKLLVSLYAAVCILPLSRLRAKPSVARLGAGIVDRIIRRECICCIVLVS